MDKLIDINQAPIAELLENLLFDRTTRKNIIWATDTYSDFGDGYLDKDFITARTLLKHADRVRPRIEKSTEDQQERTRKKAEVFTPAWICNEMNNYLDEDWFGRKDVFNVAHEDHTWAPVEEHIAFPDGKTWKEYVDSRRLEITCGEAPYLTSRYDVSTGGLIEPTIRRIGILDRKLRIVNENAVGHEEWLKWALRAFESCYGYEYQGDNLLIARINAVLTFVDYYEERWGKEPEQKILKSLCGVVTWNLWQMDGLACTVPLGKLYSEPIVNDAVQGALLFEDDPQEAQYSKIRNWRRDNSTAFIKLEGARVKNKIFDYVIGNPPYNEETEGTSDKQIYHLLMDAAYNIASSAEFITPSRFLFNAGKTPKTWNQKMLNDKHLKVLMYEQEGSKIFPNTDIKGGIAITYRDSGKVFGSIKVFTSYPQLNTILRKVNACMGEDDSLSTIIFPQTKWNLDALYLDYPDYRDKIGSSGKEKRFTTSIFTTVDIFSDARKSNMIRVLGLIDNKRQYKFINENYVDNTQQNLFKYKVLVPKANGKGVLGEELSNPEIGDELEGYTQSFIGIGSFDEKHEAEACMKYIKTKFARAMLGVLKITQDNTADKWKYVPLQDFKINSEIDWKMSIHDIDAQLYKKYGLDEVEIDFIESSVKEMA